MVTVAALVAGILAFIATLRLLHAAEIGSEIIRTSQAAMAVITNPDLSDAQKETEVQRASLKLFGRFAVILSIALAALTAPVIIISAGAAAGLYSLSEAIDRATSWPFILATTVGVVGLWLLLDKRRAARAETAQSEADSVAYTAFDQALHDYALAAPARQLRIARLENRLYARRIRATRAERPVFITSLPRAGTTMMLELLADLPEMAAQTYRQMPFPLAPLLWSTVSPALRRPRGQTERAHGDGIAVDLDSPEAFEEMAWMAFWPTRYAGSTIEPWTASDRDAAFEAFLSHHMTKVVAGKNGAARHYVSKNNANIARLQLLAELFPDARFVIPVREPSAQVASLRNQHQRFTTLHAREPFTRRYMAGIGHLEFGAVLKPIAFDGFDPDAAPAESDEFWLRYWIAAYEHVLQTAPPGTIFVDHEALSADPHAHLPALAERLGLTQPQVLNAMASRLRALRPASPPEAPEHLRQRAGDIHAALLDRAGHVRAHA